MVASSCPLFLNMQEGTVFSNKVRAFREELSTANKIRYRTELLLEIVRECVAVVMNEKDVESRRRTREKVDRIIYEEDECGNPMFSDTDRTTIIVGIDRRLAMASEVTETLDDCEAESQRGQDSWRGTGDSPWPPDFRESLKPSE